MKTLSEFLGESKEQLNEATNGFVILIRYDNFGDYSFCAVVSKRNKNNIKNAVKNNIPRECDVDEVSDMLENDSTYKKGNITIIIQPTIIY